MSQTRTKTRARTKPAHARRAIGRQAGKDAPDGAKATPVQAPRPTPGTRAALTKAAHDSEAKPPPVGSDTAKATQAQAQEPRGTKSRDEWGALTGKLTIEETRILRARWGGLTEDQRQNAPVQLVSTWLGSRERSDSVEAFVRTLSHERTTFTRENVTVQEQRDYEDAASRFNEAAKLANALAFEITAERARVSQTAYIAPSQHPAAIEETASLRKNLRSKIDHCHRWQGCTRSFTVWLQRKPVEKTETRVYHQSVSEWAYYLGLTFADLSLPAESAPDEAQSLAALALNLRRVADLFRDLARTEEPRPVGKLPDKATRRLLAAADCLRIPSRRLAEIAVDNCNATFRVSEDEDAPTRDERINQWMRHFREVRRSPKRRR